MGGQERRKAPNGLLRMESGHSHRQKFCIAFPIPGHSVSKEVARVILSYFRTVFLYLVLILVIRLMGKRQIGEMEPAEFVVTMLVANLAAIPMQDGGIPLFSGLVPIFTVLGMELVLSAASLKSVVIRRLLCGKPVILIDGGKILQDNLLAARITLDELTGHLREKDILDVTQVQYAILETDGQLSVFPFPKFVPPVAKDMDVQVKNAALPVTVIEDGHLSRENLRRANRDETWLEKVLREKKTTVKQTFLLTVDNQDRIVFLPKEKAERK